MDGGMSAFTVTLFAKKFVIPFARAWFVLKYISIVTNTFLTFFFIYQEMLAFDTSGMIPALIFLNKSFLHLDENSAS